MEGTAAIITQGNGLAGIKINAGNYGGEIDMTRHSSISVTAGSGSSRNGLVLASKAAESTKTFTLNIDGTISSAAAEGDAIRLEGTSYSAFDVTFGRHAKIGGGTGDDGVMVTGAQSLLLRNYGQILGGSGQPDTGGEGINVGNGHRIAADGISITNNGTITGTASPVQISTVRASRFSAQATSMSTTALAAVSPAQRRASASKPMALYRSPTTDISRAIKKPA